MLPTVCEQCPASFVLHIFKAVLAYPVHAESTYCTWRASRIIILSREAIRIGMCIEVLPDAPGKLVLRFGQALILGRKKRCRQIRDVSQVRSNKVKRYLLPKSGVRFIEIRPSSKLSGQMSPDLQGLADCFRKFRLIITLSVHRVLPALKAHRSGRKPRWHV